MGIVGCGIMGKLFARLIDEHGDFALAAVCDHSRENVNPVAEQYNVPGFTDVEQFYDQAGLEAVYIATPDFAHYSYTLAALQRDIHVLVEKPLTMDRSEAEALAAAEGQSKAKAMVRFGNRCSPPYMAAKNAIAGGEHGRVLSVKGHLNDTIMVPTEMISWSDKTTPAWFLLSHVLDLAAWFTEQRPVRVYAAGVKDVLAARGIDTYDAIQAQITYQNGAMGQFETSWVLPNTMPQVVDMGFQILCEQGIVKVDTHQQMVTEIGSKYSYVPTLMTNVEGKLEGYLVYSLDLFAGCAIRGKPSPIGFDQGLENVATLEALHRSLATGRAEEIAGS